MTVAGATLRSAVTAFAARGAVLFVEGDGPLAQAAPAGRVHRVPASDRATAGVAVGMALGGVPCVVEVADTSRLLALAEVMADAARMAAHGPVPVLWWVATGGGVGLERPCLDGLVAIDGLQVWVPADEASLASLADEALASGVPTVLLVGRGLVAKAVGEPCAEGLRCGTVGAACTVVSVGGALELDGAECVALERLERRAGVGARVRASGRLVVAVPSGEAAFGWRVVQECLGEAFLFLEAPPVVCEAAGAAAAVREALSW